ncbi:26S proteasome non-ATPase, regulatory subunit [Rhizoctonia solani]|uniref:Probable 26S proteasome regulatory subunit p27 n=1 Tax=Rhizoctonia solani TaxID=456999 RepID=A0A8H7HJ78_9AGAM|nr:26S proteasome non-ATPase, regulatory subunit [Rhizoctonia solani]
MASTQPTLARTPAQERALALMAERDQVDQQLQAHISILSSHGADMSTRLVDAQGFPRADIDITTVRAARVRVIELRNDRARLTDEIAQALVDVHSTAPLNSAAIKINGVNGISGPSPAGTPEPEASIQPQLLVPFARVDGVAPNSPAQQAGLQREDLILAFGSLTARSFSNSSLQPLAQLVASHENRQLVVKVRRNASEITLDFTPRSGWGGRGMLGCHIMPYSEQS